MTGLRARKKADTDRRIVESAAQLFRARGYSSVRMEDIAALANVSAGTLYNYYENKGDLLVAVVAMEVAEVLSAGEALLADPPQNAEEALRRLVHQYYDHSLVYLSKEMWRTAMAISIQQPETTASKLYTDLDRRLAQQIVRLIEILQQKTLVSGAVDPMLIGEVLFNNLNMRFIEFAKDETLSLDELKAHVDAQNRLIADLIRVP
ncbi:TetR/AcrR family transcriptional regulator [Methyloligella sp. 2.7D]|uniref:TetR/AcrR family transcriptional regulator n=1 Tax=unclassified Methyloligella TaxID=2625955 RepID=UPI00157D1B57|nr:TetR/AcrR family transcriptional regulator [Methyloligella sp. GL2]QKP76641.1 TetR/AcrR family transcriptional regulator [Methyloligella sp. GL2]